MLGGIYSSEKCPQCGRDMVDNNRNGVACPKHKKQLARNIFVRFGEIFKRFQDYEKAAYFLAGVRFKTSEGSYDARDYKAANPLGFRTLSTKWLEIKHEQLKRHSWDSLNNTVQKAIAEWGDRNIKEIGYADIEDFLFQTLSKASSKTRSNTRSVLNSFFVWLVRRRVLHLSQLPEIPQVGFELEFRKTIDKTTQQNILAELRSLTDGFNPRIWIAVSFLSTYISIRPGELIRIKEGEIDREHGLLIIPHPKEKRPKIVPLTDEDLELLRSIPRGFPELPFFRHLQTHKGIQAGKPFGPRYLYKWWVKACSNLGIEGVDLYGGTRHSTVIALGEFFTPEELKKASFHSTNKAFERYYRMRPDEVKSVYTAAKKPAPELHRKKST